MKIRTLRTLAKIRKKRHSILSAVVVVVLFSVYQNCGTKAATTLSTSGTTTSGVTTASTSTTAYALISPAAYAFTSTSGSTNAVFTITNASTQVLMNLTTTVDVSNGGFTVVQDGCNGLASLSSGGSCLITVSYSTTSATALTGNIWVNYNDSSNYVQTALYASLSGPGTSTTTSTGATSTQVPVYRFYKSSTGEHFFSLSSAEGPNNGFISEGIGFYVYPAAMSGTVPLYRCYATNGSKLQKGKHFTSLQANCEGYTTEGLYGYIYTANATGRGTLARYYNSGNADHLTTLNANEAAAAGYSSDGIEGYTPQ